MTQDEIIQILAECNSRCKSNTHRLDKLEQSQEAINKLASSVAVMAQEQEHMRNDISNTASDIKDVKAAVDAIAAIPAKRWGIVVEKIILVIVGGVIMWLLRKAGIT